MKSVVSETDTMSERRRRLREREIISDRGI